MCKVAQIGHSFKLGYVNIAIEGQKDIPPQHLLLTDNRGETKDISDSLGELIVDYDFTAQ